MVNFVNNLLEKFDKEGKTLKSLEKMGINNYDDGDDEPDKIPMHHLGFCLLGFILHTEFNTTLHTFAKDAKQNIPNIMVEIIWCRFVQLFTQLPEFFLAQIFSSSNLQRFRSN